MLQFSVNLAQYQISAYFIGKMESLAKTINVTAMLIKPQFEQGKLLVYPTYIHHYNSFDFEILSTVMRVVTPLVAALLTAAVAAVNAQEDDFSKNCSCITTFMELEESLLQRRSNMDNLHQAFFPSNQQFPVAVDLVVHFSTSLQTTSSQGLCNPSTARLDNGTFDYKFRWSVSATVLHFVRHEVLSFFSLFVYQGTVTTAEVVIDPICEGEKMKPEQLLNSLCIQVRTCIRTVRVFGGARLSVPRPHACILCMIWQSPSPGHPSAADEAWYWPKRVLRSG